MRTVFYVSALVLAFVAGTLVPCPAAQIPVPEGAMGHDDRALTLSCRIARAPRASVEFYRFVCGGPESFVISADDHSMLARWFSGRVGQRVPITFGGEQ